MIEEEELAAVVAALHALRPREEVPRHALAPWAMANRLPELELEDLRAGVR